MEFTKKDAAAFARLRKGKRAQVRETRRLLEKRSRDLMEQSALLKNDIDTFKNDLAAIGIRDYLTGIAHVCECAPLCPAVWSTLPVELLQLIFARLPYPDIFRLRVLSKTWDMNVTGVTPGFTKLCAEQNPIMFTPVSEGNEFFSDFSMNVKIYVSKENRWDHFVHQTDFFMVCDQMSAGDGGLVCVVCAAQEAHDKEEYSLKIVVFNPLTRQWRELPSSSSLSHIFPRMVQLVMDRDSKCYKVLVVGNKKHYPKKRRRCGGDAVARIFSSATGKWSHPNIFSDLIFGSHYFWPDLWDSGLGHGKVTGEKVGPCVYDCAKSTLFELDKGNFPWTHKDRKVFMKDHVFILRTNLDNEFILEEYQTQRCQSCQPHWVQLRVHKYVSGYQGYVEWDTQLFGYRDFLVVCAYERIERYEVVHKQTVLFDLSTSQWQIISEIPEWRHSSDMYELRWDAVP